MSKLDIVCAKIDQIVDMWRGAGIPCFQVAEGNF